MKIKKTVKSRNGIMYDVKVYRTVNSEGQKKIGVAIYRPKGLFRLIWQENELLQIGDLRSFVEMLIDTYEYDNGIGRFFHPSIDNFKEWNGECE